MLSTAYQAELHYQIHNASYEVAVFLGATREDKAYVKTYLDVPAALEAEYKALSKTERNAFNRTFLQLLLLSEGYYDID